MIRQYKFLLAWVLINPVLFFAGEKIDTVHNVEPEAEPELELLDQIESEVFYCGSDCLDSDIITRHDIFKRGFDGGKYSLPDVEDESLADQFSKVLKANITNEDINRNLKKNGLDDKEILNIACNWGFDGKEDFFEYLKKIYRASSATNFEIESQLVATQDEIKNYYLEHQSEYLIEKSYLIQTAFVEFNDTNKEQVKLQLEQFIKNKIKTPDYIVWSDPFEVKESEITESNSFIKSLDIGDLYLKEFKDGFSIYKLKNIQQERCIQLNDIKEEIVIKLKKIKHASVINKVRDKFRCNAIICRPTDEFKIPTNFSDSL